MIHLASTWPSALALTWPSKQYAWKGSCDRDDVNAHGRPKKLIRRFFVLSMQSSCACGHLCKPRDGRSAVAPSKQISAVLALNVTQLFLVELSLKFNLTTSSIVKPHGCITYQADCSLGTAGFLPARTRSGCTRCVVKYLEYFSCQYIDACCISRHMQQVTNWSMQFLTQQRALLLSFRLCPCRPAQAPRP